MGEGGSPPGHSHPRAVTTPPHQSGGWWRVGHHVTDPRRLGRPSAAPHTWPAGPWPHLAQAAGAAVAPDGGQQGRVLALRLHVGQLFGPSLCAGLHRLEQEVSTRVTQKMGTRSLRGSRKANQDVALVAGGSTVPARPAEGRVCSLAPVRRRCSVDLVLNNSHRALAVTSECGLWCQVSPVTGPGFPELIMCC